MKVGDVISVQDPSAKQGRIFVRLLKKREGALETWFLVRYPWGEAWRSEDAIKTASRPLTNEYRAKEYKVG